MGLRKARHKAKLTQEQLADASGLEQATISKLENGRIARPSYDTVTKLANALKVDPARLRFDLPASSESPAVLV